MICSDDLVGFFKHLETKSILTKIETISPTKFERLRSCALRVSLEGQNQVPKHLRHPSKAQLIGIIFHKAFQNYLSTHNESVEHAWNRAFEVVASKYRSNISPNQVRRPKLFFQRRTDEISSLLVDFGVERGSNQVKTEFGAATTDGKITGIFDLFIDRDPFAIVDFKTGIDADLEIVSPAVSRQLALYSVIVRDHRGKLPKVFVSGMKSRLNEILDLEIETVLSELHSLVAEFNSGSGQQLANVSIDSCKYCRQTSRCKEVWKDKSVLHALNSLSGKVASPPLVSANGMGSLKIMVENTQLVSIRDVPQEFLSGINEGEVARIWRLRKLPQSDNAYAWIDYHSKIYSGPL